MPNTNRLASIDNMKFNIAILLTVLAAGLALTGCASMEDNSNGPSSAPHTHTH